MIRPEEATPNQRRAALLVTLALLGAAAAAFAAAAAPAGWVLVDSSIAVAQSATAVLLFLRFWRNRFPTTLIVACAFFFLAIISLRRELVVSSLIVQTGDGAGTLARLLWFSALGQIVFPLVIVGAAYLYAYYNHRLPKRFVLPAALGAMFATVAAAGFGLEAIAAAPQLAGWLDAAGGVYREGSLVPVAAVAFNVLAVILYGGATKLRSLAQLWVEISLVAGTLSVIFLSLSGGSFVVAWYASQYFALAGACMIPVVHLYEFNLLHSRLEALNEVLAQQALYDELTGVGNRRLFETRLNSEWSRATRSGAPLSLILLDVDHFKLYNDAYGHQRGDKCLSAVARAVGKCAARPTDVVARYGGEEFAVILPGTTAEAAGELAQRMRAAVERLRIAHKASPVATCVTISLGVASCVPDARYRVAQLVQSADGALYAAKGAGRNRVTAAPDMRAAGSGGAPARLYDWQAQ